MTAYFLHLHVHQLPLCLAAPVPGAEQGDEETGARFDAATRGAVDAALAAEEEG